MTKIQKPRIYSKTVTKKFEIVQPDPGASLPFDDASLAEFLGIQNKTLWWAILNRNDLYTVHRIPKASGGVRVIHAPDPRLKMIQSRINEKILNPLQSQLNQHVIAYRENLSAKTGVMQHAQVSGLDRGTLIKMDIKDFFPSTSKNWVMRLLKHRGYSEEVSDLLSTLMTVADVPLPGHTGVPQGSPASGAICNLVADERFDHEIIQMLKLYPYHLLRYTRYSDDLAITTRDTVNEDTRRNIIIGAYNAIQKSGYRVNYKKTRVYGPGNRKLFLGIVFNKGLNIPRKEYDRLRFILHNCRKHGFLTQFKRYGCESPEQMSDKLRGKIAYCKYINPEKGRRLESMHDEAKTARPD